MDKSVAERYHHVDPKETLEITGKIAEKAMEEKVLSGYNRTKSFDELCGGREQIGKMKIDESIKDDKVDSVPQELGRLASAEIRSDREAVFEHLGLTIRMINKICRLEDKIDQVINTQFHMIDDLNELMEKAKKEKHNDEE